MAFTKATKRKAKLKIALKGAAGTGKTFSALVIARVLGGKTALADSEHGRALLYADRFDFDHQSLETFSLDTYVAVLREMADGGYSVGILDSISHAWVGKGGALEEVDRRTGAHESKFSSGWKAVTPKQNNFVDAMRGYPGHLIATMRTKMEYVLEENDRGKKVPKKVGLAPVQREGMEYEFDFIFDLDGDKIHVTKSSFSALDNAVLTRDELPGAIEKIKAWLEDGSPPAPPAPKTVTPYEKLERLMAARPDVPPEAWKEYLKRDRKRAGRQAVTEEDVVATLAAFPLPPPHDPKTGEVSEPPPPGDEHAPGGGQ